MVPLRLISEELGAQVKFEQTNQTIILSYKNIVVMLKVESKKAIVNGQEKELQVMPQVITGVTYVPIRFIAEMLGAEVNYKDNILLINLEENKKEWKLEVLTDIKTNNTTNKNSFKNTSKTVLGKMLQ